MWSVRVWQRVGKRAHVAGCVKNHAARASLVRAAVEATHFWTLSALSEKGQKVADRYGTTIDELGVTVYMPIWFYLTALALSVGSGILVGALIWHG